MLIAKEEKGPTTFFPRIIFYIVPSVLLIYDGLGDGVFIKGLGVGVWGILLLGLTLFYNHLRITLGENDAKDSQQFSYIA